MQIFILEILWLGSLAGMILLIFSKRKLIFGLPPKRIEVQKIFQRINQRITTQIKIFSRSFQLYLQKTLMRLRLLSLKLDTKLFNLIQRLKQKSGKVVSKDEYWEKIKKDLKKMKPV